MFNVDRYDPEGQKQKDDRSEKQVDLSRKKKRRNNDIDNSSYSEYKPKSTLRVIANETKVPISSISKLLPEAIDDLDLIEYLIPDEPKNDNNNSSAVELNDVSPTDIQTALSISKQLSIDQAGEGWKLAPFLVENLKRDGFQHFFPIQALVIPDVIVSERHSHIRSQDICITAPTGSGKTLAYVIPILNALFHKSGGPRRLRALVILPSRDLATQVYNVLNHYIVGSTLQVGLAIGQTDFVAEQLSLTVDETSNDIHMLRNRFSYDPGNIELALQIQQCTSYLSNNRAESKMHIPLDGWSNVDILVCTPGRLVDHLDNTPGFTLQHLRFLVVDEADRLLSQSYHKWIDRVLESSNHASISAWNSMNDGKLPPLKGSDSNTVMLEPITWRRGGILGDDIDQFNTNESSIAASRVCQQIQLRKFLVSATLTRDPQKLASLRLVNPKHFNVHTLNGEGKKYSMPPTLEELVVECTAEQKPIVLLSFLLEQLEKHLPNQKSVTIVFTASLDSTHRLARLLQLLCGALKHGTDFVGEFSSVLNQQERTKLMSRCNDPTDTLSIIVCSDGMSRGMDLDFVDTVINYDIPTLAKTYVHRCGRTARASRKGTAISLVKGGQSGLFYRMRNLVQDSQRVRTVPVKKNLVSNIMDIYKLCIKALREVLEAETNGEIGSRDDILNYLPNCGR